MKKIAFLAPHEAKLTEIKQVLHEFENEIIFEVGSLTDGLAAARRLVDKGVEVIVARGETAFNIRDAFPDIVVVDIPITGFDLAQTLDKARKLGDKLAVVSFPSMIKQIERLESVLDINVKKYHLACKEDGDSAVQKALQEGANVIIGGFTAVTVAKKRNLPYVDFITGAQAYIDCLYTAKNILKSVEQQKQRAGLLKTVLSHAYEGILSIDEKGMISSINPVARQILNLNDERRQPIIEVWPQLELDRQCSTSFYVSMIFGFCAARHRL